MGDVRDRPPYDDPAFMRCLYTAAEEPELIAEFDRLSGTNLARCGTPLDLMVDDATGRTDDAMAQFVHFVWEAIYSRLPDAALEDLRKEHPHD
jgi:hypothetical protein